MKIKNPIFMFWGFIWDVIVWFTKLFFRVLWELLKCFVKMLRKLFEMFLDVTRWIYSR